MSIQKCTDKKLEKDGKKDVARIYRAGAAGAW